MSRLLRSIALALLVAGCATAAPFPLAVDVGIAQARWPGTTQADLERGRTVYLGRCGGCHLLHRPEEVAAEKWPGVVGKMGPRAKLSPADGADLVRYLVVLSAADARD